MKRVFICSRFAGDIPGNTAVAKRLCRLAVDRGFAPFAPHLLYTGFLDDAKASEREAGISCGLSYMDACDEVWVFTKDGVSDGMRRELAHAVRLNKPITVVEGL